jgi:TP901 family phage tail tape measure protein
MTDNVKISILAKANLKALERVIKTLDAIDSRMAHVTQSIEKMSSGFSKADSKVSKTKKKIDATSKSMAAQTDAVKELTRWYNKGTKEQLDAAKKLDAVQRKQVKAFLHVQGIKKRHMAEQAAIVKRDLAEDLKLIKDARDKKKKIRDGNNKLFRKAKAAEAEIAKAAEKAKTKALKAAESERLAVEKKARKLQVALAKKHFNETMAAEKKAARESAALKKKDIADAKAAERKKSAMLKQRMALIRNSHRAEQAMHNARRARLSEMSGALSGVNQHLRSLSRGFAVMGIASTAAIVAVTKVSKDFEASLVRAATVTTGTGDDFESNFSRMSKSAIDLANETEHTAKAVGEGMNFMAMAGFNASDIIAAMPTVAKLATAANLSMADSANIVTNAMAGFGITSDKIMEEFEADTGKVMSRTRATEILAQKTKDAANVLVGAFTSSNVSLTDLNESLKIAGPVAKQLNIPIEDLAATIGLLGNVGVRGTEAGTGLKRAMVAMIKPSKKAKVAMDKLGISSDMIAGKDGFLKVVAALEVQRDKMKASGQEALFLSRVFEVFAERAGPKMAALVAQGTQSLVSLSSGIEKAKQEDLASIIEERQLNTLSGAISKLVSNVQTFAKALGDKLLPEVKKLVKDFEDAAVGARNLDDRIKDFMVTAAKFGAVGGGIGFVAVKILDVAASLTIASLGFQQLSHVTKMSKMAMVGLGAKGILVGGILVGAFAGTLAIMEQVEGKTYDIAGAFENAFAESTDSIKNMFINLFQFIASMATWVFEPLEKKLDDFLLDAKNLAIDVTVDSSRVQKAAEDNVFGKLPKGDAEAAEKIRDLTTGGMDKRLKATLGKQLEIIRKANDAVIAAEKNKERLAKKLAKEQAKGEKTRTKAQKKAFDKMAKTQLDTASKLIKVALNERKIKVAYAKDITGASLQSSRAIDLATDNLEGKGEFRNYGSIFDLEGQTAQRSGDALLENVKNDVIPAMAEANERIAWRMIDKAARGEEKAKTKAEVPDFVAPVDESGLAEKIKSLSDELGELSNKIAEATRAYAASLAAFKDSWKPLDLKLRMEGSPVSQEMLKLMGDIEGIAGGRDNLEKKSEGLRRLEIKKIEVKIEKTDLDKTLKPSEKESEKVRLVFERLKVNAEDKARLDELGKESKKLAGTFAGLRVEGLAEVLSKEDVSKRPEELAKAFAHLQEKVDATGTEFEKNKLVEVMANIAKRADEVALEWDSIKVIDPQVEIKGSLDKISEGIFGSFKSAKFFKGMEQPVKEGMASALKTGLSKASGKIAGAFTGVFASIGGAIGTALAPWAKTMQGPAVTFGVTVGTALTSAVGGWGAVIGGGIGYAITEFTPLIGAAIGALAGAIVEMVPVLGKAASKAAKAIVNAAKKAAKVIFDNTAGAFKKMADSLADQMDKVVEDQRLSDAVRMGGQASLPVGSALAPVIAASAAIAAISAAILGAIATVAGAIVSSIVGTVATTTAIIVGAIVTIAAAIVVGILHVVAAIVAAFALAAATAFAMIFGPVIAGVGLLVTSIVAPIMIAAALAFVVIFAPVIAAIGFLALAIVSIVFAVIAAIVATIVAVVLAIAGIASVIIPPLVLLFGAIALFILGVAGILTGGLGILTAALGGFFTALLFKDPKFADDDYVSQRGRAQDALSVSIDKIVMALDPLWGAVMPLVGLFDYLMDIMLPLAGSFANGAGLSSVLFQGFKMLAVGIGMLLLGIGYFVSGVLSILVGGFGNPIHQFMGNLMETIAQGVVNVIAWLMRGLANIFKEIDELIPGPAILSPVTTGLNNAAEDAEAAADGLVPDFDELNQSVIDGLNGMMPDLDKMHEKMRDLLKSTEAEADARANALADQADEDKNAKEFGESLSNVPSGFKVALHRFKAMDAVGGVSAGGGGNILDLSGREYFSRMSSAFASALSSSSSPGDEILSKLSEATDPQRWSSVLDGVAATFEGAAKDIADLTRQMLDPGAMPGGAGPMGSAFMGRSMATDSLMGGNNMIINIGEMRIDDATNPDQLANMIAEKSSRDHMAQGGTPFPTTKSGSNWWNGGGGRGS